MNTTKRRQLSADWDNPTPVPEYLMEFCFQVAECEGQSYTNYARKIEWANYALNRFDRGFLCGYLAAMRVRK